MKNIFKNTNQSTFSLSIRALTVLILLTVGIMMGCSCNKSSDQVTPKAPVPSITDFSVVSTSMTEAVFHISVKDYARLVVLIGSETYHPANLGNFKVSDLAVGQTYTAKLIAFNSEEVSRTAKVEFKTKKSNLKLSNFKATDSTYNSIKLSWNVSSDTTIAKATLMNLQNHQPISVIGKSNYQFRNLTPDTKYSFQLTLTDASGTKVSKTIKVSTLKKPSDWLAIEGVSYGDKFAIDGNAVSSKLVIKITNTSSATKTLKSLQANFGKNGSAVKMLRYVLNNDTTWATNWTVLKASKGNGEITFQNLILKPGINTIRAYFALKPHFNVSNGAKLSFQFSSLDDGDGAGLPSNGEFPQELPVGSVNANATPSIVVQSSESNGIFISTMYGNLIRLVNSDRTQSSIFSFGLELSGPSGARIHALHLYNPWHSFPLSYGPNPFDPNPKATDWVFFDERTDGSPVTYVPDITWSDGKQNSPYITLIIPKTNGNSTVRPNQGWNQYFIYASFKNDGNVVFDTDNFETPTGNKGDHGYILKSIYWIQIYNSDGQLIDLSDVNRYR